MNKAGTLVTLVRVLGKYESDEVIIRIDAEDVYGMMCKISSSVSERRLRTKINDIQKER